MNNPLSQETSLYLRQHADNPAYCALNEDAITAARLKDLPILLSIGCRLPMTPRHGV